MPEKGRSNTIGPAADLSGAVPRKRLTTESATFDNPQPWEVSYD